MDASELDYELPDELIAQAPLPERDGARLLCLTRGVAGVTHRAIRALPELCPPALWVVNDTKVIPARLFLYKPTGGKIECLLVERVGDPETWLALGQTRKGVRPGMELRSERGTLRARVLELRGSGELLLSLEADGGHGAHGAHGAHGGIEAALQTEGRLPLPPYIRRAPDASDDARYQTVFASHAGAVAAPTAGLHLSERVLEALRAAGHELAYVTLHVGPGTFAPLRAANLTEHHMHAERYHVPDVTAAAIARAKLERRPVVAVGTTVVRTLEASAAADGGVRAGWGSTNIFIYPPFQFRVVDALLTNFHLPRSTLLALVMAFAGIEPTRVAYRAAVAERYRFFSYGDAMWIGAAP